MKKLFMLLFAIMAVTVAGLAQSRTVTGSVVSSGDNEPVIGASVRVVGTNLGTVTDVNGKFRIPDVPLTAKTLTVSFIGMATQEMPIIDAPINVVLQSNAQQLDEVVVTALGISRSEKTLGYSATQVGSAEIERAQTTNVMSALAGKVAGLQVQTASAGPGSASNVSIRGLSSINGSNQPLYVVDGVPMTNSAASTDGSYLATSGIANISPDDIAAVTVLKGAAATALYGSRASNGVIMITTKNGGKGANGKNYQVTYSGNVEASRVGILPEMQNEFGQGWNGVQTYIENGSWGPALDGSTQVYGPIWNNSQRIHTYDAKKNNMKDFFDTGWSQNHNVSLSGVSADSKMTYYFSYTYTDENGMIPTDQDSYRRNTFAFRGSYQPEKWFKVSTSVNHASYRTKAVGQFQGASVIDGLLEFPRDISIVDLKDTSIAFNNPEAYFTPYGITNPYWALENNLNETNGKQTFGKVQLDFYPIDGLTLTYRYGFDSSDYDRKIGTPQIQLDDALINEDYGYAPSNMNQDGNVYAAYYRRYEYNHDFMAQYANNNLVGSRLGLTATAGVTLNERGMTAMAGQADGLTFYTGFWQLSNGSTYSSLSESQSKRRSVGLYGDVSLGWDDYIFLDLTARNDWSSTLPENNRSYFYSGATLAGIFTKFIPKNDILTFGKVRLAYGKTGNDADPYYTTTSYIQAYSNGYYGSYIVNFPFNGTNAFMSSATAGSSNLRPEMTTEFEAGLNLKLFNSRIDLDFAFYNRVTDDQIFTLPVDPSTGYSSMVTNFGKIRNRGIELMANFIPVQLKNFTWEIGFNWAKNWNKVLELPESLEDGKVLIYSYSAGNDAVAMYAEEGKPLGTFWTRLPQYVTEESSPYYGQQIVGSDGLPLIGDDTEYTGYNMQHKWIGGITTSFSAYGFTLSAALDIRYGGKMFCRTANLMEFTGNGVLTTYNGRNPFVMPNTVVSNGDGTYSPNTTPIYLLDGSYQDWYDSCGWGQGGMMYLIDRSYTKLRNISLTYQLPRKWLRPTQLSDVAITLYGNNLCTWTAKDNLYSDPEVTNSVGYGDLALGFGQYYANPSPRQFGVNLKVTF